ncbi:MAG: hypothetical protein KDA71_26245 [Planctomycetales bacterium]|nr:hypothetical protein [Planctomycetales bacterium]
MTPELRQAAVLVRSLPRRERSRLVSRLEPLQRATLAGALLEMPNVRREDQLHVRDSLRRVVCEKQQDHGQPDAASELRSLVRILSAERPAVIAAAINVLPPVVGCFVVKALPRAARRDVLGRLARMTPPDAQTVEILRAMLVEQLDASRIQRVSKSRIV